MDNTCQECGYKNGAEVCQNPECGKILKPRTITPHKGGRTLKKSTDVTPETAAILAELWQDHHVSLGDVIEWAAPLMLSRVSRDTP